MKAPSTLNTPIWLTPAEGASYLGTDVTTFLPLLESGQLTLRRSPDQGLRFHRDDLDAVLLPVPPAEAVRLLMAETSETPDELMNPTSHPHRATNPSDDMRSLKEAAVIFEKPYKTLLRLASEGAIPAIDLNAHRGRKRPRYAVSISALRRHFKDQSEKQAAMRRARPSGIDLLRLAQPRRGAQ